ncbi:TB182 protein, partial [Ardeotis kori]|nr:TB182 protein [Ardeotis kori]
ASRRPSPGQPGGLRRSSNAPSLLLASLAGNARPKPPVRPKPRVLPKPAVPAKPSLPHPPPGPRHPRPELPSAEKMNRLAGPQPYSGGGSGGPLRRPSFTLKSPETPNGKGLPSPPVMAAEDTSSAPGEEAPPAPPTPPRKGPAPFKVTPVPVATKLERFPGTTVEEILAKMDSREGPGSPDRARLSPFCPDPSSRFGSKTFAAFRRRPSGEADGAPPGEARPTPQPAVGELGAGDDGGPSAETSEARGGNLPSFPFLSGSGSPPAGLSCAGDPRGRRRPPSPPDVSSRLALPRRGGSAPGLSPSGLSCLLRGSLSAGCVSLLSPRDADRPFLWGSWVPPAPSARARGQGQAFGGGGACPCRCRGGSPDTASPPGTPELPPRVTGPPGSPEAAAGYPSPPSPPPEPPAQASRPPGSPEGPNDSPVSPQSPEGPDFSPLPRSRDLGLRRSSEGVLRPPAVGQGMGELGGSLSALPRPGAPLSELSLGSESSWSLSQSFEWTFPARGARQLASPPRSPIQEMADSGLSEESESDGEDPAPCPSRSRGDSGSEGPSPAVAGSRSAEGAPCPGGPMAQREAEGSEEEEEEEEAEQDATVPCSPLCVTEPDQDPAEPEHPAQPSLLIEATPPALAPPDLAPTADSALALAGDSPVSLQGPGGPGQDEGSSQGPEPHADPGWLTELLASPRARAKGPEVRGRGEPPGCGDWPKSRGTGESCLQDQDFGAGKPEWGTGYGLASTGSRAEIGSRKADWSSSYGVGRGQQQDEEPSSRQPSWAGRYGSGDPESRHGEIAPAWAGEFGTSDAEMKDRELTPGWTSKYSSRDAETKDKDFTLGWAGRSSTGDTGSPDKEFSPGRPAWDSSYSTRDMESQDREFSPSRPARTGECSTRDMESQDREFSPSRPAWGDERGTRDMESRDGEFKSSRSAWQSEYRSRDMESQDQEFSPSRLAWDDERGPRDVEVQDWELKPSRSAWDDERGTRDTESRDVEFKPSRSAWDDEFSPSRPAWDDERSTRDGESRDGEFKPSRLAWVSEYSPREMETQDSGFKPGRPIWDDKYSARDVESQDREFSPSRPTWASKHSSPNTEKEEQEFSPGRLSWAGEGSMGQTELVDAFGVRKDDSPASCAPDPPAREPGWGSTDRGERGTTDGRDWAEELGGAERHNQFGVIGTERVPDPSSAGASDGSVSWSGGLQQPLGDWHSDLSFGGCLGTGDAGEVGPGATAWGQGLGSPRAPDSSAQRREAAVEEPGWSRDLEAAGWSTELRDAEAKRREWASAFGARCAARSRDFGAGEQSPGGDADSLDGCQKVRIPGGVGWPHGPREGPSLVGLYGAARTPHPLPQGPCDFLLPAPSCTPASLPSLDPKFCPSLWGNFPEVPPPPAGAGGTLGSCPVSPSRSIHLLDPSPPMGDAPPDPPAAESPRSEPPSPTEGEQGLPEPAAAPRSPRASPPLPEAAGGTPPDTESDDPSDHLDGRRPPSWEEKRLSLDALQPEGPADDAGQEFTFLEDTEVLDSSVYRSKADLGRKRRHRAPALRPAAASEGDSWIFRDSTEPQPARPAASSDEEAAEEPKSRRVRASPLGKGVKVPLFPGLNASALKAKLRGRNRSAEEGALAGDSKGTPPKDPHVQRSKSCKIPGLSGKPLALPPKPEKPSG